MVTRVLLDVTSIQPSQATVVTYLEVPNKELKQRRRRWRKRLLKSAFMLQNSSLLFDDIHFVERW